MTEIVGERLTAAQAKQKLWYDKRSRAREFSPGDQVLVLLPSSKVKRQIIDEGLDPEQRRQLEELLREFSDVMQDRPGLTNLAQHHIDTGDAKPSPTAAS
ncbi:Hypp8136 [Branchiostoma lanceolatum]|uniref:Hypp8136 protein n=1 Tax=Branchiostoma lanceolatum TaxID=7740 RepID=A0A8K0ECZ9_BRALA|nr:Hypp8136 [Branchiostoma lanceolatum]